MPTPIDPKRLPGLKAALADFGEEEWASQQQLAQLYGVANSRFTTLVKSRFPDFPAHERRDDKTHWYPARPAIASMIRYMEDTARGKQVQARRHTAVMSGVGEVRDAVEPEEIPLTATELDRLASARTRTWKLEKDMGLYTLTSEVQRIAKGVNQIIAREVMNMVNEIDPNGELSGPKRQRITNRCREIVLKIHDELGRFLEDDTNAARAPGIARIGNGSEPDLPRRSTRQRAGAVERSAR